MRRTLPIVLLGCCTLAAAQESKPASQPTSKPAVKPVQGAKGSKEALALGERVLDFAGGRKGWDKVRNVVFSFAGRQRVFWDRRKGKVRIEQLGEARGRALGRVVDVIVYDTKAGKNDFEHPAPPKGAPRQSGKGTWINHTYWLLVSLKVMDPGVTLSIDPAQKGDGATLQRLRLKFDGVGVTPQNEYVLRVERDTGRVLQWDFYRSARTRQARSWKFEDYRRVGPLRLSLSRPATPAGFDIRLADVAVNVKAPDDIWTSKDKVLGKLGTPKKKTQKKKPK